MELARFECIETEVTRYGTFTTKYIRTFKQMANGDIMESYFRGSVQIGGGCWPKAQGLALIASLQA